MRTRRYSLAAALAAGVAIACGGSEPPPTAPPPAAKPASSTVPVGCVAKWTTGASGTFTCEAAGPQKATAKITAETLKLDQICVNDARITTITVAGGKTVPLTLKPTGPNHCGSLGGATHLPESCNCTAPEGGDCNAPPGGFICIAGGHL